MLLLGFGWMATGAAVGQQNLATQFDLYESEDEVHLTWVIEEGNICQGIEIERSVDGLSFELAGRIDGVCGSFTGATRFDYVDAMPALNRVNHYRLRSQHDVISPVRTIEVVALPTGHVLVKPNPMAGQGAVYFENPTKGLHNLELVDLHGAAVLRMESRSERIDLDVAALENGIYAFVVRDESGAVVAKGRLVVGR